MFDPKFVLTRNLFWPNIFFNPNRKIKDQKVYLGRKWKVSNKKVCLFFTKNQVERFSLGTFLCVASNLFGPKFMWVPNAWNSKLFPFMFTVCESLLFIVIDWPPTYISCQPSHNYHGNFWASRTKYDQIFTIKTLCSSYFSYVSYI